MRVKQKNKHTMKNLILSLAFITAIIAGTTTAFAQQVKEQRSVSSFSQIFINGSVDVSFTQGDAINVTVIADKEAIGDIITRVKGDALVVSREGNSNFSFFGSSSNETEVLVTAPELIIVEIDGSGDFEGENTLSGSNFSLKINGSGDFECDMDMENMKVNVAGSGDSEFSGITGTLDIAINGSGDVECDDLRLGYLNIEIYGSGDIAASGYAETTTIKQNGSGDYHGREVTSEVVNIQKSGSGDAVVLANKRISVQSAGSGDTVCYGNPEEVEQKISGSGDLSIR